MKKLLIAALLVGVCNPAPALAALAVKDGNTNPQTLNTHTIGGNLTPDHVDVDGDGAEPIGKAIDTSNCATDTTSNNLVALNKCLVDKGKVVIAGAAFTTPSGTTNYLSGYLIANSATAGSVTPMAFTVCRNNGGNGTIWRARFKTTDSGFSNLSVSLKLYRDSPTAANGDHAAWSTTESNYIGTITVSADQAFTDSSGTYKGIGTPVNGSMINYDCASGTQTIYGLEVAGSIITPVGAKPHTWVLEVTEN